jgi:hypothetical protein
MNDYWCVIEISTGKLIAHCGEEKDAQMLVSIRPGERTYRKQRFIMDQVIDITSSTDKQLPGQIGLPSGKIQSLDYEKVRLPEGEGEPLLF